MAHHIAAINPRVTADVISANEFPALSQAHQVMSVPKIVVNGTHDFVGAQPENVFLSAIHAALGETVAPSEQPE